MQLQVVKNKIVNTRSIKVVLDFDLAQLYEVETRLLNQTLKRNIARFPSDFMFQLDKTELENLKSQTVTSSWSGTRKLPFAYNEQGVAMLSSVLKPLRAMRLTQRLSRYVCHAVSVSPNVMQMLYIMTNETQTKRNALQHDKRNTSKT